MENNNTIDRDTFDKIYDWIGHYPWLDKDGNSHIPTLLHDLYKDFRQYL